MEETLNNIAQTANGDTVTILERIDRNTKNLNQDIEFLLNKWENMNCSLIE